MASLKKTLLSLLCKMAGRMEWAISQILLYLYLTVKVWYIQQYAFPGFIFFTTNNTVCHGPFLPLPPGPLSRVEDVDCALLRSDSGVESALLYAKAWSKYTKDVLAWVDKRLSLGEQQPALVALETSGTPPCCMLRCIFASGRPVLQIGRGKPRHKHAHVCSPSHGSPGSCFPVCCLAAL